MSVALNQTLLTDEELHVAAADKFRILNSEDLAKPSFCTIRAYLCEVSHKSLSD
ncbi:hypothetical protein BV25DRAFT_1825008 [Artomyces pyxidatus]|uniref:Uncharacterized protein n=1 Tax=Artomyces pyxidatus TaxID=48021 RepID=A0ACB8T386_9AGAM|nr:hypothetical protein BV25DRAFT_1825008 [Artomyces pyxidatus]